MFRRICFAFTAAIAFLGFLEAPAAYAADPFTELASAGVGPGSYAVFGLGAAVNLSNVAVTGNVGTASGGSIVNQAPSSITGSVFEATSGQYSGPGTLSGSVTINPSLVSQNASGAALSASDAAALTASQNFAGISGATVITGSSGLNVVKVNGNINLSNVGLTLSGPADAYFVINVTGNLTLSGSAFLSATGGVSNSDILYNFTASNATVNTGVSAVVNGILLATGSSSSMTLDGAFNGEIIAEAVTLLSGATLTASGASRTPSVPAPEPPSLLLLAGGAASLLGSRFRRRIRHRHPPAGRSIGEA